MVVNRVHDIGEVGVAPAQPDRIVHAAKTGSRRLARLLDKGARNLPATQQGVSQPVGLVEDGQAVDVVPLEDLTAVVTAVPLLILQEPRVVDSRQISIGQVDSVRVGVVQLTAHTPPVLETQAGLQTVVGVVRRVLFLGNPAISRVGAQLVRSGRISRARQPGGSRQGSEVVRRVNRESVDISVDVLMPPKIAHVLNNRNHGRLQFMLYAETPHGGAGSLVGCIQRGKAGRIDWKSSHTAAAHATGGGYCRFPRAGWSAEVNAARIRGVFKGQIAVRKAIDVVALQALVEGSEAAAEHGPAVAEQILSEPYARLQRVVVVGYRPVRHTVLPWDDHAVEIIGSSTKPGGRLNSSAGRIDSARRCCRPGHWAVDVLRWFKVLEI